MMTEVTALENRPVAYLERNGASWMLQCVLWKGSDWLEWKRFAPQRALQPYRSTDAVCGKLGVTLRGYVAASWFDRHMTSPDSLVMHLVGAYRGFFFF